MDNLAWSKPQLIVLVRSHPAEAVLVACKAFEGVPTGPDHAQYAGCGYEMAPIFMCQGCEERAVS